MSIRVSIPCILREEKLDYDWLVDPNIFIMLQSLKIDLIVMVFALSLSVAIDLSVSIYYCTFHVRRACHILTL